MAQISFPWDGSSLGHATRAPYSADEWTGLWEPIFGAYDTGREGVIVSNRAGYAGNLEVTNPAGLTLRVASGFALVDGTLYSNSANVDFSAGADGTNYIMLRKSWAAQTVRLVHNVNTGPTWSEGVTWDIVLATFTTVGGAVTASEDQRYFINNIPNLYKIQGGVGGTWGGGGYTNFHQDAFGGALQTGAGTVVFSPAAYEAEVDIVFPRAYYVNNAPIMIVNVTGLTAWADVVNNTYVAEAADISAQGATIRVRRSSFTDGAIQAFVVWTALSSMYPSRQG